MFQNRVPFASMGATGAVLALVITLITQFTITPVGLTSVTQDPPAPSIPVMLPDGTEFLVLTTEEITSKTATERPADV